SGIPHQEGFLDVHEKGFIHFDLELGNILAFPLQHGTHLPTLKIADFRLAKQKGVKDTMFGFRGTRYYMSPKSVVGKVSGALDIWLLGCIVAEMITGRSPWDTHDRDDLRDKLLMGESPNILEDMSKLGKSFLRECFTINPNKRWNASKLLCHPYLLLSEHMFPKDNQQSLPYFQQQKVLESQNIPPLLGAYKEGVVVGDIENVGLGKLTVFGGLAAIENAKLLTAPRKRH
ncbi:hypothetical protein Goshw_002308, partial [Gossypium schwendimanii]|nr:hypothetical protein [Gossypium schwendimanii]